MDLTQLKKIRQEMNLFQLDMAKKVGVTLNTYRNWELGANEPSEENMEKLKKVLEEQEDDNGC